MIDRLEDDRRVRLDSHLVSLIDFALFTDGEITVLPTFWADCAPRIVGWGTSSMRMWNANAIALPNSESCRSRVSIQRNVNGLGYEKIIWMA